jgi:hypothetical protein
MNSLLDFRVELRQKPKGVTNKISNEISNVNLYIVKDLTGALPFHEVIRSRDPTKDSALLLHIK